MNFGSAVYRGAMLPLSLVLSAPFSLHSRGRVRLRERYGDWNLPPGKYLWFHGASLGEVQGLLPLARVIRQKYPYMRILFTSTSPTGLDAAQPAADEIRLLPFDAPCWIERALQNVSFSGFIFGETELWPALLAVLQERNVPCCLVNARISDATARWYERLRFLFSKPLAGLAVLCAGDAVSGDRLAALGAQASKIIVAGNAKFDKTPVIASSDAAAAARREMIGGSESVLTLGSIHPQEWDVWRPALQAACDLPVRIILAPRHSERFQFFAQELTAAGIEFESRSELKAASRSCSKQILLLDTLGELETAYSFSLAAFIGGTIRDIGGHNPLEAAVYGVALSAGPSRWNVRDIARDLEREHALATVTTAADAKDFVRMVAEEPVLLKEMGARARLIAEKNRGATERIVNALQKAGALAE